MGRNKSYVPRKISEITDMFSMSYNISFHHVDVYLLCPVGQYDKIINVSAEISRKYDYKKYLEETSLHRYGSLLSGNTIPYSGSIFSYIGREFVKRNEIIVETEKLRKKVREWIYSDEFKIIEIMVDLPDVQVHKKNQPRMFLPD